MKQQLQQLIAVALQQLQQQEKLSTNLPVAMKIESTRDEKHGDFACNVALLLASVVKKNPREIAELIVVNLPPSTIIANVNIAGPGFINFFLTDTALQQVICEILAAGSRYGSSNAHVGVKVHIEYVSSNPTGPLHVGHGRSAAFGASLANILQAVGYTVHREYYVNDAGRQMNILATSVWLRYLALYAEDVVFPVNGYQGDYVKNIAKQLQEQNGDLLVRPQRQVYADVPRDAQANADPESNKQAKEAYIDAVIHNAQQLLGDDYTRVFSLVLHSILDDIREDLTEYRVTYDAWFSEQQLVDTGMREQALQKLADHGFTDEKDGALWFKSSHFGDDKDRVLRRANGMYTYFANDIAYHLSKLERGYDRIIDVLGADHHGYLPRMRAAIEALCGKKDVLIAPMIQFVSLYRGREKLSMSTRSGKFVTLRALRNEVGDDVARFFYIMRKGNQHMDFDLALAKSQSNENPVYYIQYAHARIGSVLRQLKEKKIIWHAGDSVEHLELLDATAERQLLKILMRYPEVIEMAARDYEPHFLTQYLRELATNFHSYYNSYQFIVANENLRNARLNLIVAVKQVIANGLVLLGVSAPERM